MKLSPCITDDDYEAFRAVRIAVEPGEQVPHGRRASRVGVA